MKCASETRALAQLYKARGQAPDLDDQQAMDELRAAEAKVATCLKKWPYRWLSDKEKHLLEVCGS
jgi:hypothetical protein